MTVASADLAALEELVEDRLLLVAVEVHALTLNGRAITKISNFKM